jgi:hypothetical protein
MNPQTLLSRAKRQIQEYCMNVVQHSGHRNRRISKGGHSFICTNYGPLNGCASVLKTNLSRLIKSGSLKIEKKYLRVSAVQKLSMLSSFGADGSVTSRSAAFVNSVSVYLDMLVNICQEDTLNSFWSEDVSSVGYGCEARRQPFSFNPVRCVRS